jgi:2'-hydroxyisoflavone reductase
MAPMARVLILGGSWFLGRTIADHALARDWHVTTFRRGLSGDDAPGVITVKGDRTKAHDLTRLAEAGPWDAVIDTSGFVPRETLEAARALEPVASRYVFISSVSAYQGWPVVPLTESSPLLECPANAGPEFGHDEEPGPSIYGYTKAGCERAIYEVFGFDRTVVLRPGVILGPREYVGRLPWWLQRIARGGRVLAPGQPHRSIQPVDVRDVADFALRSTTGQVGAFNVTASGTETMGDLLVGCREVTGSDAVFEWVTDEDWLVAQDVAQWTEIPLWRTYPGVWDVDSTPARVAGFSARPLRETVLDTWAWLNSAEPGVAHQRASEQGIDPHKEQDLLNRWDLHKHTDR